MQLGSPYLTYKCFTNSPRNPFILGSMGQVTTSVGLLTMQYICCCECKPCWVFPALQWPAAQTVLVTLGVPCITSPHLLAARCWVFHSTGFCTLVSASFFQFLLFAWFQIVCYVIVISKSTYAIVFIMAHLLKHYCLFAPYRLRGSNMPWFTCWFQCYINCLFACLLNFFPFFYFLFSLWFLSYLLPYLFTSWLIHVLLPG